MASTAQFKTFGPFMVAGELVTAPVLYHYATGTTTLLNAYTDRAKSVTAAQPIEGDANGVITGFFDGLYTLVVQTSTGDTLFTWNNVALTEDESRLEGSLVWDPPAMSPGQDQASPTITVTGAAFGDYVLVAAPYSLQGLQAIARVTANNTVTIRLTRPLNLLYATTTYDPGNLVDGAGETSPTITVTGAALNDAVVVYPPYALQALTVTGYVSAADTVRIRVQNGSGSTIDLASGTWQVAVLPRSTPVDLPSGTWRVRVLKQ